MLTNAAVKAARPMARAYKRADGRGLVLHVAPTGTKSWRLRYRDAGGREQTLCLGQWPEVSLDSARLKRDAARARIDAGGDPRDRVSHPSFAEAAALWHAHRAPAWSAVHAADVLASLERDVFPAIGALQIDAITKPMVLELLRRVERRGAIETARRLRQRIQDVCKFAIAEGWATIANPGDVGEALANAPATERHPALIDPREVRALIAAVDALEAAPIAKLASLILALTAVRIGSLLAMTWAQLEALDGPEAVWRVPAAHMKLGVNAKLSADNDHLVPLTPAAISAFRAARELAGEAGVDAPLFPIGEGAIGALYDRAGYAGRHVPHGWRASFSTILNERFPESRAAIDRALGHAPKDMDKVERAYNRAQHMEQRRALMRAWAEILIG